MSVMIHLSESGFRRWIIRNFCELKEHVLTQCKETKNLERRFNEMLTRMDNLERNISELMELKNTTRELHEACTSFNSRIDQAEERITEAEDQLNEIKQEGKIREKRVKRNEQSLQEIWDYVKRPNLRLIGVPECEEENESKLENTLQDIIQENFPNLARQANIQVQEIQRTPQRYSSRRTTPRHIIIRFTRVEMKEKMLREAREKGRVTHKGKSIRLTADLSAETLQARREWGPTFNILQEKNFQPRISYPAKLSFISEGKIKFFANKQVLRDFVTTRPALQELLKEALHIDGNNQYQPFQKHTKRGDSLHKIQLFIMQTFTEGQHVPGKLSDPKSNTSKWGRIFPSNNDNNNIINSYPKSTRRELELSTVLPFYNYNLMTRRFPAEKPGSLVRSFGRAAVLPASAGASRCGYTGQTGSLVPSPQGKHQLALRTESFTRAQRPGRGTSVRQRKTKKQKTITGRRDPKWRVQQLGIVVRGEYLMPTDWEIPGGSHAGRQRDSLAGVALLGAECAGLGSPLLVGLGRSHPHKETALERRGLRSTAEPGKAQLCGKERPRRKTKKQKNFITNKPDVHSETQSQSRQLQRRQVDKSTKMGRNQCKRREHRNQNASPPTGDRSSS
ncbi:LINE-1 retrotransposable element ORF1 protein [Plecturocebus cupreus]